MRIRSRTSASTTSLPSAATRSVLLDFYAGVPRAPLRETDGQLRRSGDLSLLLRRQERMARQRSSRSSRGRTHRLVASDPVRSQSHRLQFRKARSATGPAVWCVTASSSRASVGGRRGDAERASDGIHRQDRDGSCLRSSPRQAHAAPAHLSDGVPGNPQSTRNSWRHVVGTGRRDQDGATSRGDLSCSASVVRVDGTDAHDSGQVSPPAPVPVFRSRAFARGCDSCAATSGARHGASRRVAICPTALRSARCGNA